MGYDIKAEREKKERQAKRTAVSQARIDRINTMKDRVLIFGFIEKVKVLLVKLTGKIRQEYAKEREKFKSPLFRCRDCGREISKRAESCSGCGTPIRKKQKSGCGCGGFFILCFLGVILFSVIFGNMLSSSKNKTVRPASNITKLPVKPAGSASNSATTNPNQFQEIRQEEKSTGKWYEGGNLHHSNLATWKQASYANKLATAADWAFTTTRVKRAFYQSKNFDIVKPFAIELMATSLSRDKINLVPRNYHLKYRF